MTNTILSIFKVGIGPSSSHTVGPVVMGNYFCKEIANLDILNKITRIRVDLYGSLSFTGKGHLSDTAILLGLSGYTPDKIESNDISKVINDVYNSELYVDKKHKIEFIKDRDVIFNKTFLELHENAMIISAYSGEEILLEKTYFSIGGGFVKDKESFFKGKNEEKQLEIDFKSAQDLLDLCSKYNKSISEIALMRELQLNTKEYIYKYYNRIWEVMRSSMINGLITEGTLPGSIRLQRRAKQLYLKLIEQENKLSSKDDFYTINWISAFAIAVSEENAAGNQVVTAPTNGACAIVPAVMAYYDKFYEKLDEEKAVQFLLTASAIGYIYKTNASISGAEAGCQAEIGSASSMTAVAVSEMFGATPKVACSAGEIAMEHHLGMTCDPVDGLVQIPCIERNSFGAVKAVMSAKMAMNRTSDPVVNLDDVIQTMYSTGKDMDMKYRETSEGGLAKFVKYKCTLG